MAAIVDININENETWVMVLSYWVNKDRTEPIDISSWVLNGTMSFSDRCIPMSFTTYENEITCRIEASELLALPLSGKYTIEVSSGSDLSRLQQGSVEVDRSSVCS